MTKYLVLLLVLAAGVSQPFQVAMHAKLNKTVGSPFAASLVTFLGAAIVVTTLWTLGVGRRPSPTSFAGAPWWAFLCGPLGVLLVVSGLVALPQSGAALVLATLVFGQMVAALAVDHFGWLETPRVPINAWRIAGVAVIFAGVLLLQKR